MITLLRHNRMVVAGVCAMAALLVLPATAESSSRTALAKRSAVAMTRTVKARLARIARLDLAAHRRTATRLLAAPRKVFRYVPVGRGRQELKRGFARITHFTSHAGRGRPLSALNAQRRYGLPQRPGSRLAVTLPKGTPVKTLKAHGGQRGIGEVVTMKRLPPSTGNVRTTPLR